MATTTTTTAAMLLLHALLALTALQMTHNSLQGNGVEALPITSRPIEGNAQLLAWEEWQRLSPDQRILEKEKKVTAKSIFTLPFRHCPPGHKQYGERCIPQINIDPTDLVKQELLELIGEGDANGNGNPTGNTDYDYSDSESESEELIFSVPLVPLMQRGQLPIGPASTSSSAAEDQALPSEDAPLKFNIFENKYPTAIETSLQPAAINATTTTTTATTVALGTASATTTPMPTIATMREDALKLKKQPDNRIAEQFDDLQADASHAMPSTTTLSIPSSSSSSSSAMHAFGHIGNIEAIVLPAGLPLAEKSSIQLVTSSVDSNADADETETETETETEREEEADGETSAQALAQLLKVDTLLPAYSSSSLDLLPPFSHRRVSPLLSADLDDGDETAATDMAPTGPGIAAAATPTTTAATTATTAATQQEEQGENRVVLKKSKVQPVQLSSTVATTTIAAAIVTTAATTTVDTTAVTTITMPTTIAESTTATDAATTTTTVAAAAETKVAAIHQDANGNASDDDRFYYQNIVRNAAGSNNTNNSSSSTTNTSTTTTIASSNVDSDLDVLNYMASSDNLMTNTIGGQGESEKGASEMNFEQELRIINELVKGKRRFSQQQQQQLDSSTAATAITATTAATTTTTTTNMDSSSEASSSTTAATSDATATTTTGTSPTTPTERTTFWSKLMPIVGQSTTEANTAATATATLATAETAKYSTTTATEATAAATTATHLSINTNRSNRNSKIIRMDSLVENPTTTIATTTETTATPVAATTTIATTYSSSNDDNYTPFWWLPNLGLSLDRQVDENGEDRSLLLRFFRTFRAGNTSEATTATLSSRR